MMGDVGKGKGCRASLRIRMWTGSLLVMARTPLVGPPAFAAGSSANADAGDEIRCRCGSSVDDGFSIACDVCGRWCHAACFGSDEASVPEEWRYWVCAPGG
ncbi:hypothetical protein B0H16DRAFT_1548694 [Mycena metata]|uniref:Zinc finger PHD-type domain-containing protein n=1 Tax=Mycena metata TaxID=1033252 RepID=A0AAD7IUZ3_9AGAR|nr:hypothetical protein B0H16DRAFT_1548694 [Mycena metata]